MYFSKNKHLLSRALMATAGLNLAAAVVIAILRILINRQNAAAPDMADALIWNMQMVVSIVQLVATCAVFWYAWRKLAQYLKAVPEEDREEMGRLQEEAFGGNIAALSAEAIRRLLEIWAVILIGTQFVYDITSIVYRNFVFQLFGAFLMAGAIGNGAFESIYNNTHGFKYLGMLIAIFLGIMMTGIFLNDKLLKGAAVVLTLLFLFSFSVSQMSTLSIFSRSIGIVWTSLIFHITDTVGLLIMAVYLRKHYLGV